MIEIRLWDHKYDPGPDSNSSALKLGALHSFAQAFIRLTNLECSVKHPEALWRGFQHTEEIRASRCNELIASLDPAIAHIIFLHCSFERGALGERLRQAAEGQMLRVALLHFSDEVAPDEEYWGYTDQNHFKGLVRWLGRRMSSDEYLLRLANFLSQ